MSGQLLVKISVFSSLAIIGEATPPENIGRNDFNYIKDLLKGYSLDDLHRLFKQEDSLYPSPPKADDEAVTYALASITPLLGRISDTCRDQSLAYIDDLFNVSGNSLGWGAKMFDSNGKMPSGLFAEHVTVCDLIRINEVDECGPLLRAWSDRHPLPQGYGPSLGSYMTCLGVDGSDTGGTQFRGQFCPLKMSQKYLLRDETSESLATANASVVIPQGGTYWTADIISQFRTQKLKDLYLQSMNPRVGMCVPSGCSGDDDVKKNFRALYDIYGAKMSTLMPCVTEQSEEEKTQLESASQKAFASVMLLITVLIAAATAFDFWKCYFAESKKARGGLEEALICFSLLSNVEKLMRTGRSSSDALPCLDGMRVISMTWVVLGHSFSQVAWAGRPAMTNFNWSVYKQLGLTSTTFDELLVNGYYSVDTFFYMGGLLVAYLTFIELDRKRFNLPLFYVLRYLRITIPMAFIVWFTASIMETLVTGPVAGLFTTRGCQENWWHMLLYINVYVTASGSCLGQGWYLGTEWSLFVASPFLILPMYYFRKSRWGLRWWAFIMLVFTLVPMSLAIKHKLPPFGIETDYSHTEFEVIREYYYRPYTRAQPYIMGILMGYVLYVLRGKELKMHWTINLTGWIAAALMALSVMFGLSTIRRTNTMLNPSYSRFEAVAYESLSKVSWSLAMSWVTLACTKGYGGLVNRFLSWGFWQPLAKLSYMAYLVHLFVIYGFIFSRSYEMPMDYWPQFFLYVGYTCVSFVLAVFGTLWCEVPFALLIRLAVNKLLLAPKKKKNAKAATSVENGLKEPSKQ